MFKIRKDKKRIFYLNHTVILIMMAGYFSLLILLLCMDWYLIAEYQSNKKKNEESVINAYMTNTEQSMEKLYRVLYDIYKNDQNFKVLSGTPDELQQYSNAYDLRMTMTNKMTVEEALHGFFIFYGGSKVWYNINTDKVKPEQAVTLNRLLKGQLAIKQGTKSWINYTIEDETFTAICFQQKNITLYGINRFGNIERELSHNLNSQAQVMLIENGTALKKIKLAKSLGLVEITKENEKSFSEQIGKYYVYGNRIKNTDLWICVALPYNVWSVMNLQQLMLLVISFISIFLVFFLYRFLRKEFVSPLHSLTEIMNQIGAGELKQVPMIGVRFYELQKVNETLGIMVSEIEKQKLLTYEEIIEKQKAQMQYLQLQLKPHFYLNGLKTMNALIMQNEPQKLQELILGISKHLRYLLNEECEMVPLSSELDFVRNYVELQKHMHGREVRCEIELDDRVEGWKVPILCIQTFVENSIKYVRLGSSKLPLEITVRADLLVTEEGNYLDLIISDNGQGYTEEILEEINGGMAGGRSCIGIHNIKRRCRLLFGEKAEYYFLNSGGAYSELIIPEV